MCCSFINVTEYKLTCGKASPNLINCKLATVVNLMMADVHFVLFCFLLCFYMPYSIANYDFFKFVQQWPRSTCNGQKRCSFFPPTSNFTIHGLWATNNTMPYPAYCGTTAYITGIVSLMVFVLKLFVNYNFNILYISKSIIDYCYFFI